MTGRKTVGVAVLMTTALASCGGVRTQDEPSPIDPANVPEVLTERGETADDDTEAAEPPEIDEDNITRPAVWFIRTGEDEVRLLPVPRKPTPPANMTSLLEALLDDVPSEDERAQNITTAIPETTELASPPRLSGQERGVLMIDLTPGIWDVQGPDLRNAFGQIVCTVTEAQGVEHADDVNNARFLVNGEPTSVLDGRGAETRAPLNCDNYRNLVEPDDDVEAEDADAQADDAQPDDVEAESAEEGTDTEGDNAADGASTDAEG